MSNSKDIKVKRLTTQELKKIKGGCRFVGREGGKRTFVDCGTGGYTYR